jgi:hypothetical protein
MNDQVFSQSLFSKAGTDQLIAQVESFLEVYTEAVLVLLVVVAVAVVWMSVRESGKPRRRRPARRNSKSASDVRGGLQISRDSIC